MSAGTVFLIAGIAAVFGFGRDIIGLLFKSRKMISESKSRADREPYDLNAIILDNTKEAVAVQSALLLELRTSVAEERKGKLEAQATSAALQLQLDDTKKELYSALIRLHKES